MSHTAPVMEARQRDHGREGERRAAVLILAVFGVAVLVIGAAEHGLFSSLSSSGSRMVIPGVTLDDDDDDGVSPTPMPVVTSLRSDSEAERLGVRVGDHIAAVNGRPIRNVAALKAIVTADGTDRPVALHILRGSAVWNVAIDRAEPSAGHDRVLVTER